MYLDNYAGVSGGASGFSSTDTCPKCLDATEVMLEKCTEMSHAQAVTRQDVEFDSEGKLILTEEHYGELKKFYYDGKMTPSNPRKTSKKIGKADMFYRMLKRSRVKDFYEGDNCETEKSMLFGKDAERFARWMDIGFINEHLCGTSSENYACSDCNGLFDDIGSDDAPFEIVIPKGATAGSTAFDDVAVQFYQYLINVSSVGDNLKDACSGQKYIWINQCFKPLVNYIEKSILASCDRTCAMPDSMKPITTMTNAAMPHIYFKQDVPVSTVNGNKVSDVLAGYYGDDALLPSPVFYSEGNSAKYDSEYDYTVYRYQYANIRPDRKWAGKLLLRNE